MGDLFRGSRRYGHKSYVSVLNVRKCRPIRPGVNISLRLLLGPLRIIPLVVNKYCNFGIADCFNIACTVLVVSISSAWKAGTYMLLYLDVLAIHTNRALPLKLHIYNYCVISENH